MSHTITVRLPSDLAEWLAETSAKSGVPQGKIIRDAVERVRVQSKAKPFMRLAGSIRGGPRDVSSRKGFSRS
ncbi:MAG: ribbon-helix-helix protein, CopG family [Myxococcota bacterium]